MKRLCLFLTALLISSHTRAQDKSALDIDFLDLGKVGARLQAATNSAILRNPITELTLIAGGYFTIGTSGGVSSGALDDRCSISFGHPYALTSYPIFAVDGLWQKPDEFFVDAGDLAPHHNADTLEVVMEKPGLCKLAFAAVQANGGNTIELNLRVKNLDTVSHHIGLGLVFDPALGRWGDGHVVLSQSVVARDTLLRAPNLPASLEILERAVGAPGMGIRLDFVGSLPDQLVLANWAEVYQSPSPTFAPSILRLLYDLTIKASYDETEVAPHSERSYSVRISLLPPDFGNAVFMRWDLPSFLSIESNLLFPRLLSTLVHVANVSTAPITEAILEIHAPSELTVAKSPAPFSIGASEILYQRLDVQSRELYEDRTVAMRVQCVQEGEQVLDEMIRNVFIPAIPVSDTGLVVSIDTVDVRSLPKVSLIFEAKIQATQQLLTRLSAENVFLFENESRLREFTMEKDTTGGTEAADIVFVLDVTGSMSGEIGKVKNNIIEFADSLSSRGISFRLGMVTFLDVIENVYPFTTDVQVFQQLVAQQFAHGGGDEPENSLEALKRASEFSFRPTAKRVAIWITDASYHEQDGFTPLTKQEVIDALLANDLTVHAIGNPSFQTSFYDPITIATGGNFYDIYGNFRDILIDIARFRVSGRYRITYTSPASGSSPRQIRVEVHYAGLGGSAAATYTPASQGATRRLLACYPNPFNPTTRIRVNNPGKMPGEIAIYNLVGQRVRLMSLPRGEANIELRWDGRDDRGILLSAGFYFVHLSLFDSQGKIHTREVQRVVYLK